MTRYLDGEQILAIHKVMIGRYGGSFGVRDWGLIESALARPQAGFGDEDAYPDLFMKAAVLLHSLIKNHGFIDGNKRTATSACGVFLLLNGLEIESNDMELVELAGRVAEDKLSESEIAAWLKTHSHKA